MTRITGILCEDLCTLTRVSLIPILIRIRNVLDKAAEKIKTYILYVEIKRQLDASSWHFISKY